ncbi:MAG: serine/threonine-protein kinase [Limisphaera sp.]|nr:serine/threonine-protein kinase [Limisphaera sp.]
MTEREIFLEALDQPTPEARATFLAAACGHDPVLRASVEALLRHHRADGFLETPAMECVAQLGLPLQREASAPMVDQPGDRIGPYKLLQRIGEGGVGIVFMAEQERPVRRRVALKLLKPGMDSKAVLARFESERQALALMEHPNIARVFDAGTTSTGRPYFVMELVPGSRITDYCDEHRLPLRERLELFIQVCEAIQHAHQKGIIHRDIKPSNVLVVVQDGMPRVKVIDFGIAKALDHPLTDKTLVTEVRTVLGTPVYMSPEQADMGNADIDTRADIYSLGVLLYELLISRTPFDEKQLRIAGFDQLRCLLREQEPAAPSKRFRALPPDNQTCIARHRRTEPSRLLNLLRGDLDWIALKALDKDRARRYPTAYDLARDIRRHLDHEPVQARPPSVAYRVAKLIRRHRLVSGAAAAAAFAMLVGLGLAIWQYREKSGAYERVLRAEQEQAWLRLEAEQAWKEAETSAHAARLQAYAADMNLAQQALAAHNLGRARQLLDRHRPQGRSGAANPVRDLRGWEWRYLWQLCQSDALFTLCRLPRSVNQLEISYDGRILAIGQADGEFSLWDLRARREFIRLAPPAGGGPFAFSPTGPVIAFVTRENSDTFPPMKAGMRIRIWNYESRIEIGSISVGGSVSCLAFAEDGLRLLTGVNDTEFVIWSVQNLTPMLRIEFPYPENSGRNVLGSRTVVTPDLSLAAQALKGGYVRVLDLRAGRELWSNPVAEEHVTALALTPDGRWLATAGGFVESEVRLWEAQTGRSVGRLEGHRTYVRALRFWPHGRKLASASADQTIHLWDLTSLSAGVAARSAGTSDSPSVGLMPEDHSAHIPVIQPSSMLRGHRLEVWSLVLVPDQTTLISGAKDGEVCVWDTAVGRSPSTHHVLPVKVQSWSFTTNGSAILTLDEKGRVTRWFGPRFQANELVLDTGVNRPLRACFSPDARWLALLGAQGSLQIWSLRDKTSRTMGTESGSQWPVGFVAGGNQLITYEPREGIYRTWDCNTLEASSAWQGARLSRLGQFPVFTDGIWLVTMEAENSVCMRNVDTGTEEMIPTPLPEITALTVSPDARWLAMVSLQGSGVLWDRRERVHSAVFHGFLQGAHSVAFSPDGRRVVIGSNGNEAVKLWDAESLQELLTLAGSGSIFVSTAFSPDGNVLAACNMRGELHIWEAPSFEEITRTEQGHF